MSVTDKRVLIAKVGVSSGAIFGQKVKSFSFDTITSVEVSAGLLLGRIQITASGTKELRINATLTEITQAENAVLINRKQLPEARQAAAMIEERRDLAKTTRQTASAPDLASQLAQLATLRDSGALTSEEFDTAKKRLLTA